MAGLAPEVRSRHALFTKSLHPFDAGVAGAPALDASERLARYLNEQELSNRPAEDVLTQ